MNRLDTCGFISNRIVCGMTSFTISKERVRRSGETIRMAVDKFLASQEAEYAPFPDEIVYYGRPENILELAKVFKE